MDAIKGDQKNKCWGRAKIVDIEQAGDDDDLLSLEFEYENPIYDTKISQWSTDIAPLESFSTEGDWKLELKEGDTLDAYDKAKAWYPSTVLSLTEQSTVTGRKFMNLDIAFRIYCDNGDKKDLDGKRYKGWSAKFDEIISANSPRIAKLHTHTRSDEGRHVRGYEEPPTDDTSDPAQAADGERIYAVIRQRKSKSALLTRLLNQFGQMGGYDLLMQKIENAEDRMSFETMKAYLDIIGKNYAFYHRDFAQEFIPKITDLVRRSILEAPAQHIRNV